MMDKDPNPLATGPTKWRADRCVTHHYACDCREWEHAGRIAELERDAERMLGSLRVAVIALAHASESNKASAKVGGMSSFVAMILNAVVVAVVPAATPGAAQALPDLAQLAVIFCAH